MKNATLSLVFVSALAACSSTKKEVAQPTGPDDPGPGPASTAGPKEEVATGDLKEALLKLQRVHFGLDSSELLPEARQSLGDAGTILKKHPEVAIYVEGNSDERGTEEYNIALSEKRARTVVDYLSKLGIEPARLTIVPRGETNPLTQGSDADSLAENRRVDFRLKKGDVQLILESGTRYDDKGKKLAQP